MRRNNETKTQTLKKSSQQQLQPPIYDSVATKPTQSVAGTVTSGLLGNNPAKTILSSATNPFTCTYDRSATEYRHCNSNHESNFVQNYHTLATASQPSNNHQLQSKQLLDLKHQTGGGKFNGEFDTDLRIPNNTDLLNLSNSSIANQLLSNSSGGGGAMRLNSSVLNTAPNSSMTKELNRTHHSNRSHIITDTLPGPESCV